MDIEKDIEELFYKCLQVPNQMYEYGGLCGGWSLKLISNPKKAFEFWKEIVPLCEGNNPSALTSHRKWKYYKKFFISIMELQSKVETCDLLLGFKPQEMNEQNFRDENHDRMTNLDRLVDALKVLGYDAKYNVQRINSFYDDEEYDYATDSKQKFSSLKTLVDTKKGVLISLKDHYMSIVKGDDNLYYVCDTNAFGYVVENWSHVCLHIDPPMKCSKDVEDIEGEESSPEVSIVYSNENLSRLSV